MTAKVSAKKNTEDAIIEKYMTYVLEHEVVPKSSYKFCKNNGIKEQDFYEFFGSIEGLQAAIWEKFYFNTKSLIEKNKEYEQFSNKDKMLTFLFTFFELITLNRSYVLFVLKEHQNVLKNVAQLKGLRRNVKRFATELIKEANEERIYKFTKRNPTIFSEGAWLQFLFLLKFWMEDGSPSFEKTDMAIEKSVNTVFDLFDNTPLESIIDFGKFLYKENFA